MGFVGGIGGGRGKNWRSQSKGEAERCEEDGGGWEEGEDQGCRMVIPFMKCVNRSVLGFHAELKFCTVN